MNDKTRRIAQWIAFPAFYLFCLALFGYFTFPFDRLKDRVVAELEKRGRPGEHIEIGTLGPYYFTGIRATNVRLSMPQEDASHAARPDDTASKETVIAVDALHVRARILPLLIGRVRLDFGVSTMGGDIWGTAPVGSSGGDLNVELSHVDISKLDMLTQAVGVPLKGIASGKLSLSPVEGKFSKANGVVDLTIADAAVSDGKTKIQGLLEMPTAKLGDLTLQATAKQGVLTIEKLSAAGTDLEVMGDGKINLKEPWGDSVADLNVKFRFTDVYRGKNATTKSLLGEPGSAVPGLIEMQVPKLKRAKRIDGFYGFHVFGPLKRLKFEPTTADSPSGAGPSRRPRPAGESPKKPPAEALAAPPPAQAAPPAEAPVPQLPILPQPALTPGSAPPASAPAFPPPVSASASPPPPSAPQPSASPEPAPAPAP